MRFMLTFTWKQPPNDEIMAIIPAEAARYGELVEQGIAEEANNAADRSTFWAIWHRESLDDVDAALKTLPLYDYVNVQVSPLAEPER